MPINVFISNFVPLMKNIAKIKAITLFIFTIALLLPGLSQSFSDKNWQGDIIIAETALQQYKAINLVESINLIFSPSTFDLYNANKIIKNPQRI